MPEVMFLYDTMAITHWIQGNGSGHCRRVFHSRTLEQCINELQVGIINMFQGTSYQVNYHTTKIRVTASLPGRTQTKDGSEVGSEVQVVGRRNVCTGKHVLSNAEWTVRSAKCSSL